MVLTNFPLTFNDKINLFVFVLAHIPTKHPASTSACCWVSTVDRAAPHVPHPICINLWEERQEARKKQLYYNDLGPWLWRYVLTVTRYLISSADVLFTNVPFTKTAHNFMNETIFWSFELAVIKLFNCTNTTKKCQGVPQGSSLGPLNINKYK